MSKRVAIGMDITRYNNPKDFIFRHHDDNGASYFRYKHYCSAKYGAKKIVNINPKYYCLKAFIMIYYKHKKALRT